MGEQVFFVDVAQRFIDTGFTDDEQAAVWGILQLGVLLFAALGNVQTLNVAAGNHHAEDGTFGKREDTAYHGFFVFLKMPVVLCFVARFGKHAFAYAHHAQDVLGGALAPRAADIVVFAAVALRNLVKHFNQDGEADSGVEVAFRDVEMEGFGDEAETDHQQET